MSKGKTGRPIGKGMKPRNSNEIATEGEIAMSAETGQEQGGNGMEKVSEIEAEALGEQIPISSEGRLGAELLQENALSSGDFEEAPIVPSEAFAALEELTKRSEEVTGSQPLQNLEPALDPDAFKKVLDKPTFYRSAPVQNLDPIALAKASIEAGLQSPIRYKRVGVAECQLSDLGELSNGEFRATVRIREGYIEGIRQQAAADNMELEDWLTMRFADYIEQWFFAAGSK